MNSEMKTGPPKIPLRVVVIGPCASGKTTLVEGLKCEGYDAVVCGQEHSEISNLWQHSGPDFLVLLEVNLGSIRARRGEDWPESIYLAQLDRLHNARKAANLVIDTSIFSASQTLAIALEHIRRRLGTE
jgi:GTPase SAR1 family protein